MNRYKPTKNDLARTIVCALYSLPKLPPVDDKRVKRLTNTRDYETLHEEAELAHKVINQRLCETK